MNTHDRRVIVADQTRTHDGRHEDLIRIRRELRALRKAQDAVVRVRGSTRPARFVLSNPRLRRWAKRVVKELVVPQVEIGRATLS